MKTTLLKLAAPLPYLAALFSSHVALADVCGNASATDCLDSAAKGAAPNGSTGHTLTGFFHSLSNILIFLVGAIAVIVIIVSGLRLVLSGGNATAVQGARNGILYGVVGVAVAILAYAIVHFVTGALG